MRTLIKTKLLEGKYLELREQELFREPLRVIYCKDPEYNTHDHIGEQYMFLSTTQQKKGKITNTQQSKFPPYSYYKMYKFLFKPYYQNMDTAPVNVMNNLVGTEAWEKLRKVFHP